MAITEVNMLVENKEPLRPESFEGVVVPLSTPWKWRRGLPLVDGPSLERETRNTLPYVDILFPMGNAGEGTVVDIDNWRSAVTTVMNIRGRNDPNKPVIAGVLRNTPDETRAFSCWAKRLGVNAVVVAPLLGNDPEQILQAAIDGSELPVILYNNPSMHQGRELSIEFVSNAIKMFKNKIIGIKSSTKDFGMFKKYLELRSYNFKVFQGSTIDNFNSLIIGADGIVPVEASIYPQLLQNLWLGAKNGNIDLFASTSEDLTKVVEQIRSRKSAGVGYLDVIRQILVKQHIFDSSEKYCVRNK